MREVASNKQSRIWAPVGKCKRKPFRSDRAMGDKATGPWEALVFTGGVSNACGGKCPWLTVGGGGSPETPLPLARTCKEHPKDHLLRAQGAASLLGKEILNYVVYLTHTICLGVSPLREKRSKGRVQLHKGFSPMASVLLISFYESSYKKELSEHARCPWHRE